MSHSASQSSLLLKIVMEESNNRNNKSDKERKTRVVKSNVDVTIVKDAKSFIDKVIEVRGLNKE